MDLVASCKDKLTYFRIKELKGVLTQLGISKQGKKQDLVDRILSILSDEQVSGGREGVAKLVDDTYRKMQVSGATDLASKPQAMSDSPSIKLKTEDSYQVEKIRCLCGSSLATDSMTKCEDPRCNVWQHISCVLIPEKPMEGVLPNLPDMFYCEICRLSRADPFWMTVAHPLHPVKLNITNVPADGSSPIQSIEKTFQLTRADRDLLSKQEYDVQAWCMLLNDKVTFRMQWPQKADLQINGVPVRTINRRDSELLGANGRDDGPVITPCTRDGINEIFLGGCDARIFCVGVRIVKRRTLQQIRNMIPKDVEGEPFEDAVTRVRRCVGGGAATENADSDSDIEVVADFIPVNLRCPMSGLRMKVAGRFKPCAHMGCFDLDVFVEMNQRSKKWQCPICLKNYSLEKMIVDPYFNRITSKMQHCGEDVSEIEVKPDGSWRAKPEGGDRRSLGELGLWHFPDGSLRPSDSSESTPKVELKPIKEEAGSDSHAGVRLGMKKNQNGCWLINKPNSNNIQGTSPANRFREKFESNDQCIITMSSSVTGSGKDCEDASVNQDGGGILDFSAVNGIEYESIFVNINRATSAPPGRDADVIVLTDSDEEVEPGVQDIGGIPCTNVQNLISDPYYENAPLSNNNIGNPSLGLFGANDDNFGIDLWSLPSGSQGGPRFQLFSSDVDVNMNMNVNDALVDMRHDSSLNCPPSSINGYNMSAETAMGSVALVPGSSAARSSNNNKSDGLVDNPLAFSGNDPSLQIFLPTRTSDASAPRNNLREQDVGNADVNEDWTSLRLGDGVVGTCQGGYSASGNHINGEQQLRPNNRSSLGRLADNVSSLLGKSSKEISDGPFTFPRQRRSVRSRLYLSIDSDSE